MAELTSGYVAGIIAFLVVIVKIVFPTALSFILAGQLREGETAATWTVASTPLQASYWPTWLGADASQSHGVRRSVTYMTLALPTLAALTGITGIVTPLGLHEKDVESSKTKTPSFAYAPDTTGFGLGTSPRESQPFTRLCNYEQCLAPCPYTTDVMVVNQNDFGINCSSEFDLHASIPDKLHEIFQSGTSTSKTTVSNFFDIGWRQMTTQKYDGVDNGDPTASGAFRYMESFSLSGGYRVIEGLVVDAKDGGIGFRNHTLPQHQSNGATWSEDLLFLEPESYCTNNNITIDFEMDTANSVGSIEAKNVAIVDHGGFVNINTTNPIKERQDEDNKPDLQKRSYIAAWTANAYYMLTLNVSNPQDSPKKGMEPFSYIKSDEGREFELPEPTDHISFQSLDIPDNLGYYLGFNIGEESGSSKFDNPWNVTYDVFDTAKFMCEGVGAWMYPELNNTFVSCFMVRGVPRRVDDGPNMIFQDGSRWSAPLYTCATALKASIKTVTFFHNGTTDNIEKLSVREVKEKEYPDEKSKPLWGTENWPMRLGEFQPVWGLVDAAYEKFEHVSTIREAYYYLVGTKSRPSLTSANVFQSASIFTNLPGAIAPIASLQSIASTRDIVADRVADFTAQNSMSLWMKWRNLSASADTTTNIIKLLWTDLAASSMVGTKGVLGAGNAHPDEAVEVAVTPMVHRVMFHYAFAVPAFVTLFCLVVVLVMLVVALVQGKSNIKTMDQRLKQTSLGRSLTTLLNPDTSSFIMPSKDWSNSNGRHMLNLGMGAPGKMEPQVQSPGSMDVGPTPSSTFYSKLRRKPAPSGNGLSPTETFEDTVELVQQYPPFKSER